jgi:aspartyl-tRNA(Asn)/glutamyl-tRNA(Gln) amidotransferase subunit C
MTGNISVTLTSEDVKKIAQLAKLPLEEKDIPLYILQLSSILSFVSKLQDVKSVGITLTSQVTGLTNVFREDIIDTSRMLSQEEVLKNAHETHDGFIVVPQILAKE